jgi:hypothetical protein
MGTSHGQLPKHVTNAVRDPRVREILARRGVDVSALDPAPDPDDAPGVDPAAVEERAEKLRAVKEASARSGRIGPLDPGALDAVLPPAAPAPPREPGRKTGRPPGRPSLKRCVSCGSKLNTFNGGCYRCMAEQPSAADLKPVEVSRPEPVHDPEPAPAPGRADEALTVPTRGKTCPGCGGARSRNGRCYNCLPNRNRSFAPRNSPRPRSSTPQPDPRPVPAPAPIPDTAARPDPRPDPEPAPVPPAPAPDPVPADPMPDPLPPPLETSVPAPAPAIGQATPAPAAPAPVSIALDAIEALDALDPATFARVVRIASSRKGVTVG